MLRAALLLISFFLSFLPQRAAAYNLSQVATLCRERAVEIVNFANPGVIVKDCYLANSTTMSINYKQWNEYYGDWSYFGNGWGFTEVPATAARAERNRGSKCDSCFGDPIHAGTGNKFEIKHEFVGSGPFPLDFYWTYNSTGSGLLGTPELHALGQNRIHSYARHLQVHYFANQTQAYGTRPSGNVEKFVISAGYWSSTPDNAAIILSKLNGQGAVVGYERREEDGSVEHYALDGRLQSIVNREGFTQTLAYNANGRLESVTDPLGRALIFTYNVTGQLGRLDLPDGQFLTFGFDSTEPVKANLTSVTYPGGKSIQYTYAESGYAPSWGKNLLTGVIDEKGVRYSSTYYDASLGRANRVELAGGVDKYTATYVRSSDLTYQSSATITDPLGKTDTRTFSPKSNWVRENSRAESCAGCTTRSRPTTYDHRGRWDLVTDFKGVVTDYDHDANGLVTKITRAKSTPQQLIETFVWNIAQRVPTQIDRPGQRETYSYNARGQTLAACVADAAIPSALSYICGSATNAPPGVRQYLNTYCEAADVAAGTCPVIGLQVSTNGPRTDLFDVTAFTYYSNDDAGCAISPATCAYRKGDLHKVINALAQATEVLRYDGAGRVLAIQDANGIVTDTEYNARGWQTATKVRGLDDNTEVDDAITSIEHDDAGQVTKVTQADASFLSFHYDDAHRLDKISDALGNSINYVLDDAGNRLQEDTEDAGAQLKRTLSRVFNKLGQLTTQADANATPTDYTYDPNGALDKTTDPLARIADNDYDPLERLVTSISNLNGDTNDKAVSQYQYDGRSNLLAVIDPKGLTTAYMYDGLDNLKQLVSPDTGTTIYTNDPAGNRLSQVDARSVGVTYTYDALNRLTGVITPTAAESAYYDYDVAPSECLEGETYGAGRIAKIRDESGETRFCYDRRGNLVRKIQALADGPTLSTGFTYNAAGRLTSMTYPSGAITVFGRDERGQIDNIGAVPVAEGPQVTLISAVTYLPFGPLNTLTFGNGRVLTKDYDLNYGIASISDSDATNSLSQQFTLNDVGNVVGMTEQIGPSASESRTVSYDGLDRLTMLADGSTTIQGFTYDATGNRTSKTVGLATATYSYDVASHRLMSDGFAPRGYDNNGNTTLIGTPILDYDERNRLRVYRADGSTLSRTYRYNGKGERVTKTVSTGHAENRYYAYDEAGHLLGEYTLAGERLKEYVWLDDTLVAVLNEFDGSAYQFVETDHLGSPRAVVHPAENVIVWRWDLNPTAFGEHLPQGNPDGDTLTYELNLRYPGQYYDVESGLHYNYFRDYEPGTGRYVESDPIGLNGGIATYDYALSSPLSFTDPEGLNAAAAAAAAAAGVAAVRICNRIPRCKAKLAELTKKAVQLCKKVDCTVRFDKKGHPFQIPGVGTLMCMHWQVDCHIKGVKGSGFSIHSRLPICWKRGDPFPAERPSPRLP